MSERRACEVLGVDRSSVRYRSRRGCDAAVRLCIRGLAAQRRRFGYRRLHLLLTREGHHMNHKRFRRLYREEKLQVRRRGGRKRALGVRAPLALPSGPNERWSLDFVSDVSAPALVRASPDLRPVPRHNFHRLVIDEGGHDET